MVIRRQRAWMHFKPEGAKGAGQPRHLAEEFLRVHVMREQKMAEYGDV